MVLRSTCSSYPTAKSPTVYNFIVLCTTTQQHETRHKTYEHHGNSATIRSKRTHRALTTFKPNRPQIICIFKLTPRVLSQRLLYKQHYIPNSIHYSAPAGVRSIVINPSVCLSVCSRAYLWNRWTDRQDVFALLARSSSGGVALRYVLPVLWMTSCLAVVGRMAICG